ncbi:hypothetical protein O7632_13425 [Solwaraspora sp. WMMD406]|uniref:hypothetical protein n=1 Tax=Solwaraspora sp. WMMD406 TaxID=3016095 RepID=UPI002415F010|nr:hypothetical protein [Solwaraspora sp. WMMD406]MDG4765088.1 hypothetical protein [Solwaraspora sp. WMMD406]
MSSQPRRSIGASVDGLPFDLTGGTYVDIGFPYSKDTRNSRRPGFGAPLSLLAALATSAALLMSGTPVQAAPSAAPAQDARIVAGEGTHILTGQGGKGAYRTGTIAPGTVTRAAPPPVAGRPNLPARGFSKRASGTAFGDFWQLQMNLCNSGHAGCYAGGDAIDEGAYMIYLLMPDLVTVNEVCLGDVTNDLTPAMAGAWAGDWAFYVFMPAVTAAGTPVTCTNGDEYGVAVIGHMPDSLYYGFDAFGGHYGNQDSGNEKRAFACLYAIDHYYACTTHLTSDSEPIALAQCSELLTGVIPAIRAYEGVYRPTVLGGDLNLEYDTSDPENVQNCVPSGYTRKGDGNVQHIMATNDTPFYDTDTYLMFYTDHQAFLAKLTMP